MCKANNVFLTLFAAVAIMILAANAFSWTPKINISDAINTTSGVDQDPAIVYDQLGNLHCVWADGYSSLNIYYSKSTNNGTTWSAPQNIGQGYHPQITADGLNNIHVVWTNNYSWHINYRRSTNNGASFGTTVDFGSVNNTWPDIAADITPSPYVHIIWESGSGNSPVLYARSTNAGATWDPSIALQGTNNAFYKPCISTDGFFVHVVFSGGPQNLMYTKSSDRGTNWLTNPMNLMTMGVPSDWFSLAIASAGGSVHIVFQNGGINVISSADSGDNWGSIRNMVTDGGGVVYRFPNIAAMSDGLVRLVYESTLSWIWSSTTTDYGNSWSVPVQVIQSSGSDPKFSDITSRQVESITHFAVVEGSDRSDGYDKDVYFSRDEHTPAPHIVINPTNLEFQAMQNGQQPNSQAFTILNAGGDILNWSVSDNASWLDESPINGNSNNQIINVTVNTTNFTPGIYNAIININSNNADNSPQALAVTYEISPMVDLELVQLYLTSISQAWGANYIAEYPQTNAEYVGAVIRNNGTISLNNVPIRFAIDGVDYNRWIDVIPGGEVKLIDQAWNLSGPSTVERVVGVLLDPNNNISETNENNNNLSDTVSIYYAVTPSSNPPEGRAYDLRWDAYGQFSNWQATGDYWARASQIFSENLGPWWWGSQIMLHGIWSLLASNWEAAGHCYGMSSTSQLYFNDFNYKPGDFQTVRTFDMPFEESATHNIDIYHHFQFLECAELNFTTPDELTELNHLLNALQNEHKPIQLLGNNHAVLAFKILDMGDKRIINVYENNDTLANGGQNKHIPSRVFVYKDGVFHYNRTYEFLNWDDYLIPGQDYWAGFPYKNSSGTWPKTLCRYPNISLGEQFVQKLQCIWNVVDDYLSQIGKISFALHCPAHAQIIDQYGNRIGYFSGEWINEIPGAILDTTAGTEIENYLLPDSLIYSFSAVPLDSGFINIAICIAQGIDSLRLVLFDSVAITSSGLTELSFDKDRQDFFIQLDINGDGSVDTTINPTYNGYGQSLFFYLLGDANMANGAWPPAVIGSDVTYLVNYFRGMTTNPACLIEGNYMAADVNASCTVIGSDVTRLVSYFRGQAIIEYCPDWEPTWHNSSELPAEAPAGWPNCEPISADKNDVGSIIK